MVIEIVGTKRVKRLDSQFVLKLLAVGITILMIGYIPSSINAQGRSQFSGISYVIPPGVAGTIGGTSPVGAINPGTVMHVLVTFSLNDQTGLNALLAGLQDPSSPEFHHYLTQEQFTHLFSPGLSEYDRYMKYFESQGFSVRSYGDRVSMELTGNASQFQSAFHTTIMQYALRTRTYYAPSGQLSLSVYFGSISSVSGLSDRHLPHIAPLFTGSGSGETVFGSDFQPAYQLTPVYSKYGYPVNATIATILWSGSSGGVNYPPFVPSDIYNYTKNYYPSNEPQPKIYAYPFGGAPLPGYNAKNDPTHTNIESTLDLEMAASVAPGANVIEVYGASPTLSCLNTAFANILNPSYNTTVDNLLGNVSVISNSWGTNDTNDSTWMTYEQEAAARGISIFASSGDNGNTPSPLPSFPASMAYNYFGTTSVGGTYTVLSGTASNNGSGTTGITNQSTWFNLPKTGNGSQGGISQVFTEPMWQTDSPDASSVIASEASKLGLKNGVGVPDLSGVGVNMGICLSTSSGSGLYAVDGTSISAPLVAGLFAVIDHSMPGRVGYANPSIFKLGNMQYNGSFSGAEPFYSITQGANAVYSSGPGYNLVNGWGTLNASNFIAAYERAYVYTGKINFQETGLPAGASWTVNLSGTTRNTTGANISFTLPYGSYGFSINNSAHIRVYPSTGTVNLSSPGLNVSVFMSNRTYNVSFIQKGLPAGLSWSVTLNGTSRNTTGTNITFPVPIGKYPFSIPVQAGYLTLNSTGYVVVTDTNVTIQVVFGKGYNITFYAHGLPRGTYWVVKLNGTQQGSSTTAINFLEPNGTYDYLVFATAGYIPSVASGIIDIHGSSRSINVSFNSALNQARFILNGYLNGAPWVIDINGANFTSFNTTFIVGLSDGSYVYSVSLGMNGSRPVYMGTLNVQGADKTIYINLTKNSREDILGYIFAISFVSVGIILIGTGLHLSRPKRKIRL
ncbi:MAG: protease pro-enzyme activation domain-containing protein [Candidatus Thermoplasmatota archaeon]|nr:protease pro-enzyme activation domain-containing protein [Candidatus Thermoplasmatota archaeon]